MIRSFVAIAVPEPTADALDALQEDLRGADWTPPENLHLTLAFLGELDRPTLEDLDAALGKIRAPRFEVAIAGVGHFGGREPRLVWAGVRPEPALTRLQAKVETAARSAGIALEDRKFAPHVTVGRWGRGHVRREALDAYVMRHALFTAEPFAVERFTLYRSDLGRDGAIYEPMVEYALT